jgi:cyclophilin family peptidyl-prolyl cis-trans isomerase
MMSNKTLVYLLVAIILVAAAAMAGWRMWVNRQEKVFVPTEQAQQPQSAAQAAPTPESQPAQSANTAPGCERKFDAEKLTTAQVEIKNRTVEFDVQGFGKVQAQLYDQDAPKTVENFLRLINAGYYDCLTFHRVAKGFVIQGGDPTGTGSGGDSAFGGKFQDELNPDTASYQAGYLKGVLAMANKGANTNTSQFFIMLADLPLPHSYTIFGKVISGQDVVDKIGQVEITQVLGPTDGSPKTPVVMSSVKIVK